MSTKPLNVKTRREKEELEAQGQTPDTLSHANDPTRISTVRWVVSLVRFVWRRRATQISEYRRNPFLIGILALGENWHNSHHASPTAAGNGLRRWRMDVSNYAFCALAPLLRLTSKVGLSSRGPLPMR
jgi:hypothetical protein